MSIQHKDIPDNQRHLPKGFEGADTETVQVKNNSGVLEWRKLGNMGAIPGPPGDAIENVLIVQQNPGSVQFSSIQAALDAILTASPTNRFIIQVGPGIYTENIVMKPYVDIIGMDRYAVVIQAANPAQPAVTGAHSSSLNAVTVQGATNAGIAGVLFAPSAVGQAFLIRQVIFGSNDILASLVGGNFHSSMVMDQVSVGPAAAFTTGFKVTGTGGQQTALVISSSTIGKMAAPFPTHLIEGSGSGAVVVLTDVLSQVTGGSVHAVHLEDGAQLAAFSVAFQGFDTAIHAPSVGAPQIFNCSGITCLLCADDILIENAGATGFLSGAFEKSKVSVDPAAVVKLSYTDPDPLNQTGFTVLKDFLQGGRHDRLINLSKLVRASSTMGRFSGGVLSDDGGFNLRVAAGNGFLLDSLEDFVKEVDWVETVITIASESSVYVYINSNGIVSQSPTLPDLSQTVVLGRVSTSDAGIHIIQRTPMEIAQHGNKSSLFYRDAFGPIYVSGSQVSESGTRNLDITPGSYFFGVKNFHPLGGTAVEFEEHYRKAGSGYNIVTGVTQVNNTQYDNGSGTLQNLAAGKFATHALYSVGEGADEKYMFQFSQAQYDSLVQAEGADIPTPPTAFGDAVVLIARIITEQGNAALRIYDARSTLSFKAPGVSAAASHGNLFGLLANDHPQYLLRNGSNAMQANLDMGGNNIGNVGTVDGVDVSAHAARHAPNGADPLALGTPSTITDNTNDPGNSNDFSRGNHSHSHGNRGGGSLHAAVTTSVNGFMSAADKTKLDGVAPGATANQTDAFLLARANHTGTQPASTISDFDAAADARITAQKGQNNGLATLDGGGKVPAAQLPSFVDDVLEFANLAAFPVTGETQKIYTALDTNRVYRWSGSAYVEISASPGSTDAVPEGATNLYFTTARVLATLLTGLNTALTGAVTSADTVLQAFGRLQNSLDNILSRAITGYTVGANTALAATDTILQAFGKIQGQINANVTAIGLRALASRLINNGYGITGGGDLTADRTLAVSLATSVVESSASVASTATPNTIVTGFTVTPPAGTYFISISARIAATAGDASCTAQMFVGGAGQANTIRTVDADSSFGTVDANNTTIHTQAVVALNGSQAVDLRWSHTTAGFNMLDRSIICVRLA